jgi:hypothetical protein
MTVSGGVALYPDDGAHGTRCSPPRTGGSTRRKRAGARPDRVDGVIAMTARVAFATLVAWLLAACARSATRRTRRGRRRAGALRREGAARAGRDPARGPARHRCALRGTLRSQLQDAWKFFIANRKEVSLPLRRELTAELRKTARNHFILLDIGYFLYTHGEPADREIAKTALFALDPDAEIVRFNQEELFRFAHAVASERDERVLPMIDAAFLRKRADAAPCGMRTSRSTRSPCACSSTARTATARRRTCAACSPTRPVARKVLDVLIWIGSPESNANAWSAMRAGDPETFVHGATFLMTMGGPQGRWLLLNANTRDLDARTASTTRRSAAPSKRPRFASCASPSATPSRCGEELKRRLAAMNAGYGRDIRVSPAAILDSGVPREFLIEQLTRTRVVLLRRLAAEVPADVQRTNALINALRYREN